MLGRLIRYGVCLLVLFAALPGGRTSAQDAGINASDPGHIALKKLFDKADTVALVEVLSGDNESYRIPLYKARVVKSYKGAPSGATIYFGPYIGIRIGVQYFVFLNQAPTPIVPTSKRLSAYGPVPYWEIAQEGYGSMMSSFECVFDTKSETDQCDYGVRVCTDYVTLPHGTPVFPSMKVATMFGCRWTRKREFLTLLDGLR
jgi:hypothetical protein